MSRLSAVSFSLVQTTQLQSRSAQCLGFYGGVSKIRCIAENFNWTAFIHVGLLVASHITIHDAKTPKKEFFYFCITECQIKTTNNHLWRYILLDTKTNSVEQLKGPTEKISQVNSMSLDVCEESRYFTRINHAAQFLCCQGDPLFLSRLAFGDLSSVPVTIVWPGICQTHRSKQGSPSTLTPRNDSQCHSCIAV